MSDIDRPQAQDIRTIKMPSLETDERIEAEIWNSYNSRKRPPMWLLLTNRNLHYQSTKLFARQNDEDICAISASTIKEIRFSCLNPLLIRFIGIVLMVVGLIAIILSVLNLETLDEFNRHVRPLLKPAIAGLLIGALLQLGGHKCRIKIYYTDKDGKARKFQYSSPLMFSRRTADIVYLNCTVLINWARRHGLATTGEADILVHWDVKQKPLMSSLPRPATGFMHTRPVDGAANAKAAHIPTSRRAIRCYFPCYGSSAILTWFPAIVLAFVTLVLAVGLFEAPRFTKGNWMEGLVIFAGSLILLVVALVIPYLIRTYRCDRSSEMIREVFRSGLLYPARITSTAPYMAAVYADLSSVSTGPILKIVRLPELDHIHPSNLPVGSPIAVSAHPVAPKSSGDPSLCFRPYATYPIIIPYSADDPVGRIARSEWDQLDEILQEIVVPDAPAQYYQITSGEWIIWQSIHTTHTIDGR